MYRGLVFVVVCLLLLLLFVGGCYLLYVVCSSLCVGCWCLLLCVVCSL